MIRNSRIIRQAAISGALLYRDNYKERAKKTMVGFLAKAMFNKYFKIATCEFMYQINFIIRKWHMR